MTATIILYVAMSLDGYIARKDGAVDWLDSYGKEGEEYGYQKFYDTVDTIIVGNKTHTQFPQLYEGKRVFVFSNASNKSTKNIRYVSGDVATCVENMKLKGRTWLVGGANLTQQFLDSDLINEFIITIIPELLGDGIPLFTSSDQKRRLELIGSHTYGDVIQLQYCLVSTVKTQHL